MAESADHVPGMLNFFFGGASGMMAASVVQPMDLLKARMQLVSPETGKKSTLAVAQSIMSQEGFTGFYTGMTSALFRQATYGATRLGCFNAIANLYNDTYGTPTFKTKIGIGMFSGGAGALVCIPAELARKRLSTDGKMPVGHRRNYRNLLDALVRIPREEGIKTLWRGAFPTIAKSMVVNGAQLATYAQTRQILLMLFDDGFYVQFWSSVFAGLATTFASLPITVMKNRLQKADKGANQALVLLTMLLKEGTSPLWAGFWPAFARTGPHIVLTFMFLEQLNTLYLRIME